MKSRVLLKSSGTFILSILFLVLLSCRVQFVPNYNDGISNQIDQLSRQVDQFYLLMLETTNNDMGQRSYEEFVEGYVKIAVELNSLYNKNRIRPLNENSTRICEITLGLWKKYQEEHKVDNELSDGLIKLNLQTFNDLFFAMQVSEKAKLIVSNPPQY